MPGFGWTPQRPDHRDFSFNAAESILPAHRLPPAVDLWPNVPSVWDQGDLGSCTAHGSLRAFLTEALHQGLKLPMLSRLLQYYETRALEGQTASDSGGTVRDAIKVLANIGAAPESDWPYVVSKFAEKPPTAAYGDAKQHMAFKYQAVNANGPGAPMRTALARGLGIVFGFSVPASFEDGSWDPTTQVLPLPAPDENFIGGHCVCLTGYDFTCSKQPVPYFIADNSWSATWGAAGRFSLDYRWFSSGLADDLWVIQAVN